MGKRLFDFFSSAIGLLFLTPVFIIIAIWIKLDDRGCVFFTQKRVGRYGKTFHIFKFRTMKSASENGGGELTLKDDVRITRCGQYLRRSKLDELPQLANVLLGQMSLVGPRPETSMLSELYDAKSRDKILSVRPGITDLASIEFRNESELLDSSSDYMKTYSQVIIPIKKKYYLKYVDSNSFLTDLKIIFQTIRIMFSKH